MRLLLRLADEQHTLVALPVLKVRLCAVVLVLVTLEGAQVNPVALHEVLEANNELPRHRCHQRAVWHRWLIDFAKELGGPRPPVCSMGTHTLRYMRPMHSRFDTKSCVASFIVKNVDTSSDGHIIPTYPT